MARINLLPWREEYRQEKKKEFIVQWAIVAMIACACGFAWVFMMDQSIKAQNGLNNTLQSEIAKLEEQVKEINELKAKREQLIARMQVIQDLQGTRPTIVHYFDEMVKAVPNGVFLDSLKRTGNSVEIKGIAESKNRIASFMRNLDGSDWFNEPNLKSFEANLDYGEDAVSFSLEMIMVLPKGQDGEEEVAANG